MTTGSTRGLTRRSTDPFHYTHRRAYHAQHHRFIGDEQLRRTAMMNSILKIDRRKAAADDNSFAM
jgi:hypothetical protein